MVTGASAGIGAAIAKDLVKNGLTVLGLARRAEKVDVRITNVNFNLKSFIHDLSSKFYEHCSSWH